VNITVEIPNVLLDHARALAMKTGEDLNDFVTAAIRDRLERHGFALSPSRGWRSVFGQATREEVAEVDAVVGGSLEHVDLDEWR